MRHCLLDRCPYFNKNNYLPMNDPCLERVLRSRLSMWHARAFPQTVVACDFRGHACRSIKRLKETEGEAVIIFGARRQTD